MLAEFATQEFWIGLAKIIGVNIVLSGDNAVVIALAARSLPPKQQKAAVLWGSGAAVVMRILLTIFAVALLTLPWLKLIGSLLLFWIGVKLLVPEEDNEEMSASDNLMAAIRTILIADLVMSLDNVLGVAAAAKGNVPLLVFGLVISIPIIAWSSQLVLKLIDRFHFIIYAGGALLGYVAGEMLVGELLFKPLVEQRHYLHWQVPVCCAALVVVVGRWLTVRKAVEPEVIDLVDEAVSPGVAGKPHQATGTIDNK